MGRRAQSVQDFCSADTAVLDTMYVLFQGANDVTMRLGADKRHPDSCNIALMSYAGSSALDVTSNRTAGVNEISRVGATSWLQVVEAVNALLKDCSYEHDVGGAAIIESCKPSPESII